MNDKRITVSNQRYTLEAVVSHCQVILTIRNKDSSIISKLCIDRYDDAECRFWLCGDYILYSPSRSILTRFHVHDKRCFWTAFPTLFGHITDVLTSDEGYFVVYDYEDDQTVLYDVKEMKSLGSRLNAARPHTIQVFPDHVKVLSACRWENEQIENSFPLSQ